MSSSAPDSTAPSEPKETLLLEAPPLRSDSDTIQLNVTTSASVSLYDRMGPTVVASDGTLSRIGNWAEMLEPERANVLRVLGARNKIRLEGRKAAIAEEEAAEAQRKEDASAEP